MKLLGEMLFGCENREESRNENELVAMSFLRERKITNSFNNNIYVLINNNVTFYRLPHGYYLSMKIISIR